MRMLACYEDILKQKEKTSSRQTAVRNFLKPPSGTYALPRYCWAFDVTSQMTHVQFTWKCLLLMLSASANFCKFLIRIIVSLFLGQKILFVTALKIAFMGKFLFFCMYSFGYFPGIRLWFADVSEPSISSTFKGWK